MDRESSLETKTSKGEKERERKKEREIKKERERGEKERERGGGGHKDSTDGNYKKFIVSFVRKRMWKSSTKQCKDELKYYVRHTPSQWRYSTIDESTSQHTYRPES